ncbi:sugar ABC transporter permease (plasmid) [Rhizobium sp. CB3060]|uniref:carbohydrate ABC transporter permease n=1 Tax=Rhizobium sp. CB3060 TaxID=3138255 RepID=UPI0021A57A56|nr:sugar ABC transporter permease [Rhizobium tropici]UWU25121.1 sugar ABC transporter permease [Rhizobium tropici]
MSTPETAAGTIAGTGAGTTATRKKRHLSAYVALFPAFIIVLLAYVVTVIWNIWISFTDSKVLPVNIFVGTKQYERLFTTARWILSLQNVVLFGILFIAGCLILGFLLAVALDQKVRFENTFRTIFLYPFAMSFIVTGLVWQWIMNPTLGLQKVADAIGFTWIRFDWIVQSNLALYVIVLAGIWQSSGLVMAIMLAGLRGVDRELWKATRIDGIPAWRVYLHIVIPILRPTIITASVLLAIAVVRVYELVLATTGGGPGISTEVPGKFIMDYLFGRGNIGLATGASTVMFITVVILVTPWLYYEYFREKPRGN